ncbi:MAG: hypothetical protein Q9218_004643, partial [Villophora microphyllina]
MSPPEILVHVAAPSHGSDDARYRREALGILQFEPVKRYGLLQSGNGEGARLANWDRDYPASKRSDIQDTINLSDPVLRQQFTDESTDRTTPAQDQDTITSNDPVPRQQLIDAFTIWTTPTFPRPSPSVLVGQTPAPFNLNQSSINRPGNLVVERTPASDYRPRTAPSGPSVIQETPHLQRSFSDSFEHPPSVIPNSQPSTIPQNHDKHNLEFSSSPSPTHRDERRAKRRKFHNMDEEMDEVISPEDTSTPLLRAFLQETNSPPPVNKSITLLPLEQEPEATSTSDPSNDVQQAPVPSLPSTNLLKTSPTQSQPERGRVITSPPGH